MAPYSLSLSFSFLYRYCYYGLKNAVTNFFLFSPVVSTFKLLQSFQISSFLCLFLYVSNFHTISLTLSLSHSLSHTLSLPLFLCLFLFFSPSISFSMFLTSYFVSMIILVLVHVHIIAQNLYFKSHHIITFKFSLSFMLKNDVIYQHLFYDYIKKKKYYLIIEF